MNSVACIPAWPKAAVRKPFTIGKLSNIYCASDMDAAMISYANKLLGREDRLRASNTTGTWTECVFRNKADYTANTTNGSETGLLSGGQNIQPVIPALFFDQVAFRTLSFVAKGVLSTTTGPPTIIFQCRLGTTAGPTFYSGTSVGVSPTITTVASQTNVYWELRLDLTCTQSGIGSGNATLSGAGYVFSPKGFVSPFFYALEPTTPDTATWTATLDDSVTQYFNLSSTWSSASNSITCKQLLCLGLN